MHFIVFYSHRSQHLLFLLILLLPSKSVPFALMSFFPFPTSFCSTFTIHAIIDIKFQVSSEYKTKHGIAIYGSGFFHLTWCSLTHICSSHDSYFICFFPFANTVSENFETEHLMFTSQNLNTYAI